MNEFHVIRKSHDATQKNMSSRGAFNVPRDWFETNSRHQKRYSEGGKKIRGCRGLLGRVITGRQRDMQPWFTVYFFGTGHPFYDQLTPVKTRYPLTSIT